VHLIAIPGREDSLAVLLRRVHGRYAQYYNARRGRTGHLWQGEKGDSLNCVNLMNEAGVV
jgi:hypothetical protein